jgi:parvulin-like peptidyl-prolyl isomerase
MIGRWARTAFGLTLVTLAASACTEQVDQDGIVARAGNSVLTVDDAVDLLVDQEGLPNQAQVVESLADIWIDYTLLATRVARDSTFGFVDLEPLVRQQLQQETILAYRDSMVQVDTAVTEADLRAAFDEQASATEIRARHILLSYPPSATQAQKDSVRTLMESIRDRALAGESFQALAREYSQDPGTAARGGDLGFFSRGEMVRPFEDAAFNLEPGEISDIVESPYGLHIIRVEERRQPDFDDVRGDLATRVRNQRLLTADSVFVAGVEAEASPEVSEGAPDLVRDIAAEPGRSLSGRAGRRALATYDGGAYTAAEFQRFVQGREPTFRDQIARASDEQIRNFLLGMVQRELLLAAAHDAGFEPEPARVDSLVEGARDRLRQVARQIGILHLDRAPGEALEPAVQRAVMQALSDLVTGADDAVPLGQLSFQLRRGTPTRVFETGVGEVVLRVGRIRASRAPSPSESGGPPDSASLTPDPVGR